MRTLILVLSVSTLVTAVDKRDRQKCYGDLGCFQNIGNFQSVPQGPGDLQTQFLLYTRASRTRATVIAAINESKWDSLLSSGHFSSNRPTKVIIHGFLNSGNTKWVHTMRDALLHKGDFNVIAVDWGRGAVPLYDQAAANTFLVSAQLARFLHHLHSSRNVNLKNVHLIGHSLGAQVAGNTGADVRGLGRITGLDPAEPDFIGFDNAHRLDSRDADFVDVIHTDGESFKGLAGFGMMKASGDIDFYPNGGQNQPGCKENVGGLLGGIFTGQFGNRVSCSHSRALELYIESIKGGWCQFKAYGCHDWASYEAGKCRTCPSGGCPIMGYDADKSSARGSFYLGTSGKSPYCGRQYLVEIDLASAKENAYGKLYVTLTGSKDSSGEMEFTRENRHYHQNDKEKHIVTVNHDIGSVTGVKVKFDHGSGLTTLLTDNNVIVNVVSVDDFSSSNHIKFCAHDAHVEDDKTVSFTSHSGC